MHPFLSAKINIEGDQRIDCCILSMSYQFIALRTEEYVDKSKIGENILMDLFWKEYSLCSNIKVSILLLDNELKIVFVHLKYGLPKQFRNNIRISGNTLNKYRIVNKTPPNELFPISMEFEIVDISSHGMKIKAEPHMDWLFPGVRLKNAILTTEGYESIECDLLIQRVIKHNSEVYYGCRMFNPSNAYHSFFSDLYTKDWHIDQSDSLIDFHGSSESYLDINENKSISIKYKKHLLLEFKVILMEGKSQSNSLYIKLSSQTIGKCKEFSWYLYVCQIVHAIAINNQIDKIILDSNLRICDFLCSKFPPRLINQVDEKLIEIYPKNFQTFVSPGTWKRLFLKLDLGSLWSKNTARPTTIDEKSRSHQKLAKKMVEKKFIDPRLTKQHLIAISVYPFILESMELTRKHKVNMFLAERNLSQNYFTQITNWVSIDFLNEFMDFCKGENIDLSMLVKNSAKRFLSEQHMGIMYHIARNFVSPQLAFKSFELIMPRFDYSKNFILCSLKEGVAQVGFKYKSPDLVPKHKEITQYWSQSFKEYVNLLTNSESCNVDVITDESKGDYETKFAIYWETNSNFTALVKQYWYIPVFAGFTLYYLHISGYSTFSVVATILIYSVLTNIILKLDLSKLLIRSDKLITNYQNYSKLVETNYDQLHNAKDKLDKRYFESKFLDEVTIEFQMHDQLPLAINSVANMLCEKFDFKSTLVIMYDSAQGEFYVQTKVGEFIESKNPPQTFKVSELGEHDTLNIIFECKIPCILDTKDISNLNFGSLSKNLFDFMDFKCGLVAPIHSDDTNWGFMIIASHEKDGKPSIDHQKFISRFCDKVGNIVMRQTKIENEISLRKIFQKYVPDEVLSKTYDIKPGEMNRKKDVTSMFIDIRGFTAITEKYPSTVTIAILNKFFTMIEKIITSNFGSIDKFFGDGCLVTWGALGNKKYSLSIPIEASLEILHDLSELNASFRDNDWPELQVGIGIHHGSALVGNIGSPNRMEYTSIGSTINIASRLQELCKTYKSSLIVSEEVYNNCKSVELPEQYEWKFLHDQTIRGSKANLNIVVLQRKESIKENPINNSTDLKKAV